MPVALTYPGVYIEELSSGQHTITGVATSIAAFIGWAPQGPTTEAVMVQSFPEFQSIFGTFVPGVYLAYAVSQFFQNGGQQAYIVRLVGSTAAPASEPWPTGSGVTLYASNPGVWGNSLVVTLTTQPSPNQARFSLLVQLANASGALTTLESYTNLSCSSTDPQYVVAVINADSSYLTFIPPGTTAAQTVTGTPPVGVTTINFTTAKTGVDGDVLSPGGITTPQEFETALNATTSGLSLLSQVPIFNLLCVPGETDAATISALQSFCNTHRAFLIVDAPQNASIQNLATTLAAPYGTSTNSASTPPNTEALSASAAAASNSAYYFPWVLAPDPAFGGRAALFPPCGFVAGIYAATDASRGVWKAPAGIATTLSQVLGLQTSLTDLQNGQLNPLGINCLRQFRNTGNVVWGARTIAGADIMGSQWKYVPIRRLALFLESSLYDGTQWVVFEPNDEALWGQIRLNVGTFLQGLFLQGAFAGTTPQQAYFVKCDAENNPDSSVALGIVNILVGFAPLYPAEFVVIQIQQIVDQS
jgi:Bacteriophage tail sheath protein